MNTWTKEIKDGVLHIQGKPCKKIYSAGTWIWYVTRTYTKNKEPNIHDAYVHGLFDEFGSVYHKELMDNGAIELPLDQIPIEIENG